MNLPPGRWATLTCRLTRFSALIELDGQQQVAYLPNSGRMRELLITGRKILVFPATNPLRKTRYDIGLVDLGSRLVSVDSRLPSQLVYEALGGRALAELADYTTIQREVRFGGSRLDLSISNEHTSTLVEVKSVTLVEEGRALFPDAPTSRGTRHLRALAQARSEGLGAVVIFVIQRDDGGSFSPNDKTDPEFGMALREVVARGVAVYAYRCNVSEIETKILDRVEVVL